MLPSARLKGDYCGTPLSGTWILRAVVTEFAYVLAGLAAGGAALADLGRGLGFIVLGLLLVLPVLGTALLVLAGDRRRGQVFNIAAWGLASGTGLLVGMSSYPLRYWKRGWP